MHACPRMVLVCFLFGLMIMEALADDGFVDYDNHENANLGKPIGHSLSHLSPGYSRSSSNDEINCEKGQTETSWQQEILLWGRVRTLCDTTTDGGGWVTIQRRTNGDINFYRNWIDYKNGFGDLYTGFWIGNDNIHKLTTQGFNELRIDMMFKGKPYFIQYSSFSVASEDLKYKLSVSGYSGTAKDDMKIHNNMFFSTPDRDNDGSSSSCSLRFMGAWWYNSCYDSNLNGVWGGSRATGLVMDNLAGDDVGVEFSEMKLRRV